MAGTSCAGGRLLGIGSANGLGQFRIQIYSPVQLPAAEVPEAAPVGVCDRTATRTPRLQQHPPPRRHRIRHPRRRAHPTRRTDPPSAHRGSTASPPTAPRLPSPKPPQQQPPRTSMSWFNSQPSSAFFSDTGQASRIQGPLMPNSVFGFPYFPQRRGGRAVPSRVQSPVWRGLRVVIPPPALGPPRPRYLAHHESRIWYIG